MAQCVDLEIQADGSLKLIPQSSPDLNSCAYVIQSGAEVGNSIADFTPSQGLEIGGMVGALWAMAWGIKQISKTLNSGDSNHDE